MNNGNKETEERYEDLSPLNRKTEEDKKCHENVGRINSAIGVIISLFVQFLCKQGLFQSINYRKLSYQIHRLFVEKKYSMTIENESKKTCLKVVLENNSCLIRKLILHYEDMNSIISNFEEEIHTIRRHAEKTAIPTRYNFDLDPLINVTMNSNGNMEFNFEKLIKTIN